MDGKSCKEQKEGGKIQNQGGEQAGPVSSQLKNSGIKKFLGLIERPEEDVSPMGRSKPLQIPVIKNISLSVPDRPANKNVFMTRDSSFNNKEIRNR